MILFILMMLKYSFCQMTFDDYLNEEQHAAIVKLFNESVPPLNTFDNYKFPISFNVNDSCKPLNTNSFTCKDGFILEL